MTQLINIGLSTSRLPEDAAMQGQGSGESGLVQESGVTFEQQFRFNLATLSGEQSGNQRGQESGKQLPLAAAGVLPADTIVQRLPGGTAVMLGEELPTEESLKDFAAQQGMNADALAVLFGRYPGQAELLKAVASEGATMAAATTPVTTATTATPVNQATTVTPTTPATPATTATTATAATTATTATTTTPATMPTTTAMRAATLAATLATTPVITPVTTPATTPVITKAAPAESKVVVGMTTAATAINPLMAGQAPGPRVSEESQFKQNDHGVVGNAGIVTVADPQPGRNANAVLGLNAGLNAGLSAGLNAGVNAGQTTQAQSGQMAGLASRILAPATAAGAASSAVVTNPVSGGPTGAQPAGLESMAAPTVSSSQASAVPGPSVAGQMASMATPARFLSQQGASADAKEAVTPESTDLLKLAESVKDLSADASMKRDGSLMPTREPGVAIAASLTNAGMVTQKSILNRPVMSGAAFVLGAEHVTESLTLQPSAPRATEVASTTLTPPPAGAVLLEDLPDKLSQMVAQRLMANIRGGAWRFDLQLHPQELGSLDVQLEMRDGRLEAQISTSSAAVKEFLGSQLHRLDESLDAAGIKGSSIDVALHQGRHENGAQGQGRGRNEATTNSESDQETLKSPEPDTTANEGLDLFV